MRPLPGRGVVVVAPRQLPSPRIAASCGAHQPICSADADAGLASRKSLATRSGSLAAHSRARIPPIEPPTTHAHRSTPRASASAVSARTESRIVTSGKRLPHVRPSGAVAAGPVLPWQPPSTLGATTNQRAGSSA
jgi:hypothetical protein